MDLMLADQSAAAAIRFLNEFGILQLIYKFPKTCESKIISEKFNNYFDRTKRQ